MAVSLALRTQAVLAVLRDPTTCDWRKAKQAIARHFKQNSGVLSEYNRHKVLTAAVTNVQQKDMGKVDTLLSRYPEAGLHRHLSSWIHSLSETVPKSNLALLAEGVATRASTIGNPRRPPPFGTSPKAPIQKEGAGLATPMPACVDGGVVVSAEEVISVAAALRQPRASWLRSPACSQRGGGDCVHRYREHHTVR